MISKNLNSGTLVSVLVLPLQEDTVEPFRLQPSLTLLIDFSEYLKFCRTELGYGYNWLSTDTDEIHFHLREYDRKGSEFSYKKLFKAFLRDVAFAVLKELSIAETEGQDATVIRHISSNATVLSGKELNEYYVNLKDSVIEKKMIQELTHRAIRLEKISPANAHHYKYALVAYGTAELGVIWSSK